MGKYDILVLDAEHNLKLAKIMQEHLKSGLDLACRRLDSAEDGYYKASSKYCEHEKTVRSLAQKLSWQKRKTKAGTS